jgi:uncharacterized protein (DUF2141 family)
MSAEARGVLTVEVTGLRPQEGLMSLAVFSDESGFPERSESAVRRRTLPLVGSELETVIPDLSYGTYAVALFHDQNGNGKLDRNWLGIPSEGVGFSNNPPILAGPPSFDAASFVLDSHDRRIRIYVDY